MSIPFLNSASDYFFGSSSDQQPGSSKNRREEPSPRTSKLTKDMPSTRGGSTSSGGFTEARRAELRKIGDETITAIDRGYYKFMGKDQDLTFRTEESRRGTKFYSSDDPVKDWATTPKPQKEGSPTHISILQISTIDAARLLDDMYRNNPQEQSLTGVLNFASATKPGGGFLNGAEAQEESIARASTLYPTLKTKEAQKFYDIHKLESAQNNAAFYSHAMIYSPKVTVFRDDDGLWTRPFDVDILTCAAVNAGEILGNTTGTNNLGVMVGIEKEMIERMGRILYLLEHKGVRNLVLGTFGTGVFRNDVATVTRIWAQLLVLPTARFKDSFDRVIFAVTGDQMYSDFKGGFEAWVQPRGIQVARKGQSGNGRNTSFLGRFRS